MSIIKRERLSLVAWMDSLGGLRHEPHWLERDAWDWTLPETHTLKHKLYIFKTERGDFYVVTKSSGVRTFKTFEEAVVAGSLLV